MVFQVLVIVHFELSNNRIATLPAIDDVKSIPDAYGGKEID